MAGPTNRARVGARRCAVQALYQWLVSHHDPMEIYREFLVEREMNKTDPEYFKTLLIGVTEQAESIDERLTTVLDRPLQELDPVEHAILMLGVYELEHCLEIPWRVVINESIELAKMFGAEEAHKYVNSILDKLARSLRPLETQQNA